MRHSSFVTSSSFHNNGHHHHHHFFLNKIDNIYYCQSLEWCLVMIWRSSPKMGPLTLDQTLFNTVLLLYHSKKNANISQIFLFFETLFKKEYFFEIFESTARFKVWRSSEMLKFVLLFVWWRLRQSLYNIS